MSNWYAIGLDTTRERGKSVGPFTTVQAAKNYLEGYTSERGPWKRHLQFINDVSTPYYVGDGWEITQRAPKGLKNPTKRKQNPGKRWRLYDVYNEYGHVVYRGSARSAEEAKVSARVAGISGKLFAVHGGRKGNPNLGRHGLAHPQHRALPAKTVKLLKSEGRGNPKRRNVKNPTPYSPARRPSSRPAPRLESALASARYVQQDAGESLQIALREGDMGRVRKYSAQVERAVQAERDILAALEEVGTRAGGHWTSTRDRKAKDWYKSDFDHAKIVGERAGAAVKRYRNPRTSVKYLGAAPYGARGLLDYQFSVTLPSGRYVTVCIPAVPGIKPAHLKSQAINLAKGKRNPREKVGSRTPKQASLKGISAGRYDRARHALDGVRTWAFGAEHAVQVGRDPSRSLATLDQFRAIAKREGATEPEIVAAEAQGRRESRTLYGRKA